MAYTNFTDQKQVHTPIQEHFLATEENTRCHFRLAEQTHWASTACKEPELNISIKNGVATLYGTSGSSATSMMLAQFVSRIEEVDTVINLITTDSSVSASTT